MYFSGHKTDSFVGLMGKRALNSGMYKILSESMQIHFCNFYESTIFKIIKKGVIGLS
jgi:hypothetical protein